MEAAFAHSYLLLAGKFAVGGLISLAVPPSGPLSRGYYASSSAVYLALAALMTAGEVQLHLQASVSLPGAVPVLWLLFLVSVSLYYASLFLAQPTLRARIFPLALLFGLVALSATAWTFVPARWPAWNGIVFALVVSAGAALSGAALSSMLLGHWFLVDQGLDAALLQRMWIYCRRCLGLECFCVALAAVLYRDSVVAAIGDSGSGLAILAAGRLACWLAVAVLLALIERTLRIPQTMAATGLFYVATLAVVVGEILANWLLFRSGLPL